MKHKDIEIEKGDDAKLAHSTLPPELDIKDLVEIYTFDDKKNRGEDRVRTWLHDLLDDYGVQYRVDITGGWAGGKRYVEMQRVLVEEKNREMALRLIMEYNHTGNFTKYKPDEDSNISTYEDGMPLRVCKSCGIEIDFDYHKCPVCKAKVDG